MQAQFKSALHEEAHRLALSGTPVFPCLPGSKVPATPNGFHDATTDVRKIDEWWGAVSDYNIAFSPHSVGLSVIDLDGLPAHDEWADKQIENGYAPETYSVATPRPGGQHLYFRGALPPTQHKLGEHIDTRGVGSYALVPPSVIDARGEPEPSKHGTYRVESGIEPAPVPEWIMPFLDSLKRDRVKASGAADLDQPGNVARAEKLLKDYVARGNVAVADEGGNTKTFAIACEVQNLGVSPDKALELLLDIWNPACEPKWAEDELETLVQNAARYAQNEAGAWAVGSSEEVFGSVLGSLGLDTPSETRRSPYYAFSVSELTSRPVLPFLIPEVLPAKSAAMLWGPPDSYKTFLAIALAMPLALTQEVLFVAGEDGEGVARRVNAWCLANEVDPETGHKLRIIENMPWASKPEQLIEFVEEQRRCGIKPALVILDTAARMMVGLDESSARDAGTFVEVVDQLKKALATTVLVIHHSGKDAGRGERGSSAIRGGFDVSLEASANTDTAAVALWVRKMKSAARRKEPLTYEGRPLAGSLVLFPITAKEHRLLTHTEDVASNKKVGGALVALKAVGEAEGVTTRVLASALLPMGDMTEEAWEAALSRLGRSLNAKAGDAGPLEGYVTRKGRERLWHVPDAT